MAEEENDRPKRDMGKIMIMALMGANLLVVAIGTYLVYSSTLGYTDKVSSEAQLRVEMEEFRKSLQKEPVIYQMDTFNTNLDGLPRRLIRLTVNLEMLDEEGFEEVISLGAESRDAVVHIINDKKLSDIDTVQGKLHLKNQIITQVNSFLERGVVKDVYFSDFAVQ